MEHRFFSTRAAQQCAIDGVYLDLLPEQYSNIMKLIQVSAECRSRVNPLHRCSGPAVIPVRVGCVWVCDFIVRSCIVIILITLFAL